MIAVLLAVNLALHAEFAAIAFHPTLGPARIEAAEVEAQSGPTADELLERLRARLKPTKERMKP